MTDTTLTYSGATVTLHLTANPVKTKTQRYVKKFIPGASKFTLEDVGGEGEEVQLSARLTGANYFTDKDLLKTWHSNAYTVTYADIEGNLSCKITEFKWELLPGWGTAVLVKLVLNEV